MTPNEALVRMRTYPGGSYMRCPYCGCKSSTHEPDCPIEIVAAVVGAVQRYVWIKENGDMGATDAEERLDAWKALKKLAEQREPQGERDK